MSKSDEQLKSNFLSAREAIQEINDGRLTSEELVRDCLDRIVEFDGTIGAWTHLDPELALEQARNADEQRSGGGPVGPLHGIPIGIKDIIDTKDMPTQLGTPIHEGRSPADDAGLVERLREAGAIILGKTVTTEMAVFAPGKTTNPHDATRTPGGSSSGSAAAVASFMVPLAVGTQTNGSVIRPASFCGVFGFKPTFGRISRHRVLKQSPLLDTVGVFSRTLEDTAWLSDVLIGYDSRDKAMRPHARLRISKVMEDSPPMDPHIAFIRSPVWDQAEESTKEAMREIISTAADHIDIVELSGNFNHAHEMHRRIMEADLAKNFAREYRDGKDKLSKILCEMIERGQKVTAIEYNEAVESIEDYNDELKEIFAEYDVIMTPSAPGEAPVGLESTGSPAFCTIWTLCGTPALTMPLLNGPANMPMGIQMVGARQDDGRLFRTAKWFLKTLNDVE